MRGLKELRVKDEYLGKRLKCPQCGETFVATATEEADEEIELDAAEDETLLASDQPLAQPQMEATLP